MRRFLILFVTSLSVFTLVGGLTALQLGTLLYPRGLLTLPAPLSSVFGEHWGPVSLFGFGAVSTALGAAVFTGTILAALLPCRGGADGR